ncbi:sugar transporter domain-containing protein [Phthorimaea operculella]|nr:sugar transporter domain-containing protein [Phthorimaea operculella]
MGYFNQILCTVVMCNITMLIGILFTWPSSTINIFESSNTTLHRPMTETELALFGSLSSIGAMVSCPILGYVLDIVGRKYCVMGAALCGVLGWALIACCNQVEVILTAVFLAGLSGCAFLGVPIFVSEVCQESIRGTMTSFSMIFYSIGMLLSYVLGGTLPYYTVVYVNLTLSAFGVAALSIIKETPVFLMQKGQDEAAQRSFAFYRNAKFDSKIVLQEMIALRRAFNAEVDGGVNSETQALKPKCPTEKETKPKLSVWKFIKKSKSTRVALCIIGVIMTLSLCQGLIAIQVYAEPLFLKALPNISPMVASLIMAIITIIFGFVAAYLSDVVGRRNLIIYASAGAGLSCICLGSQLHTPWAPDWVTALFIYLFTITYTVGAGTVPYILSVEVFLPEIKSFMSTMLIEWAWLCNFLVLFIFNPLVEAMTLGPVFYLFAGVCLATSVFSYFFLPETKGLPIDVIQTLFVNERRADYLSVEGQRKQ